LIISKKLNRFKNVKHAFFNRKGGKSSGAYQSLNCGIGSSDKKKNVIKNLKIVCKKIGCSRKKLFLMHQIHSNKFYFITGKNKNTNKKIKADALITKSKNIALGILTADCIPILIYDQKLKIISAIHAGWKGVYKNIIMKVIKFFVKNGSSIENLHVVIGPCIGQKNYEVKKDFINRFLKKDKKSKIFFKNIKNKTYFSLNNYVYNKLKNIGIKNLDLIYKDTFDRKNNFFSARWSAQNNETDYGRNISIIMIK